MEAGRELPDFVNRYSNATLLANWREDRLLEPASKDQRGHQFSLSAATPELYARQCREWASTRSTAQSAYGPPEGTTGAFAAGEAGRTASGEGGPAIRAGATEVVKVAPSSLWQPRGLHRALLLGNGEDLVFTGEPMSTAYGAHYTSAETNEDSRRTYSNDEGGNGEVHAHEALLTATAAARQEPNVSSLYESNQEHMAALASSMQRGSRRLLAGASRGGSTGTARYARTLGEIGQRTLTDTHGRQKLVNARETLPDDTVADNFTTSKMRADIPVAHYHFQRQLPPPVV